jgi:hypothetical protein
MRLRDDGQYDIRAYSSDILISNPDPQTHTFTIEKEESFRPALNAILVDGQPLPYNESRGLLTMKIVIPGRETRHMQIKYVIPQNAERINISKSDLQSSLLRHISDFRDLVLSRSRFGMLLTNFYYEEFDPEKEGGYRRLYLLLAVGAMVILGLGYTVLKTRKSQHSAHNSKRS